MTNKLINLTNITYHVYSKWSTKYHITLQLDQLQMLFGCNQCCSIQNPLLKKFLSIAQMTQLVALRSESATYNRERSSFNDDVNMKKYVLVLHPSEEKRNLYNAVFRVYRGMSQSCKGGLNWWVCPFFLCPNKASVVSELTIKVHFHS